MWVGPQQHREDLSSRSSSSAHSEEWAEWGSVIPQPLSLQYGVVHRQGPGLTKITALALSLQSPLPPPPLPFSFFLFSDASGLYSQHVTIESPVTLNIANVRPLQNNLSKLRVCSNPSERDLGLYFLWLSWMDSVLMSQTTHTLNPLTQSWSFQLPKLKVEPGFHNKRIEFWSFQTAREMATLLEETSEAL